MKFRELVEYFEKLEATAKRLEMFEILASLFRAASPQEIDKIVFLSQGQLLPSFHGVEIGMSEKLLIRALSPVTGCSISEIEKVFKETGDLGTVAERLIKGQGDGATVEEVYRDLFALSQVSGEGSVEKKLKGVGALFLRGGAKEAKYIARFVAGRLRLGVGDSTVLEALSLATVGRSFRPELERAYNLCSDLGLVAKTLCEKGEEGIRQMAVRVGYPIRMALCERLSSPEEIIAKIGRCAVEVKMDGFRCQIHKTREKVDIFSRNLEKTTLMFPEIVEAARESFLPREGIFEGEALAYNEATGEFFPFQVTIQRKRKHGIQESAKTYPLKCFIFDLLYADGVDYTERPYSERRAHMVSLIKKGPVIEPLMAIQTDDPLEIRRFFNEAVERGLEGVVAKRLDAPYSAGAREFNWIKLKRSYKGALSDTLDLCIVGYFVGKGQRAQFGIGTVLGAVYSKEEDSFKTVSKIGTGFSEEELVRLKEILDQISLPTKSLRVDSLITPDVWVEPRYVVTVTADEITRSPFHTCGRSEGIGYALRFPRVEGFIRSDKRPEDATQESEVMEMFKRQKHVKLE